MHQTIALLQIILAILLILAIVVQQKGSGLGSTFGGEAGFYRTKRGAERMLFNVTIGLGVLFILSSILGLAI